MTLQIKEGSTSRDATSGELAQILSDLGAASSTHDHDSRYVRSVNGQTPDVSGNVSVAGSGLDAAGVRAVALAGLSTADSGDVVAGDSVLGAFGKFQAKFNAIAAAVRSVVLTGFSTTTNSAVSAADTVLVAIGKLQAQVTARAVPLAPVDINASTVLTYADHANRQLRFSGANATLYIPSDTGTDDSTWEIVTLAGSPGVPTLSTPDSKTIAGAIGKPIGATRKGLNSYDVGTTDPTSPVGVTNLTVTQAGGNVTLNSSTGTGATLPLATSSQPGLLSAAQFVALAGATANTPVTVTGSATVGATLTCSITAGWVGSGYQWTRNGANISGATSSTYVTQSADIGNSVTCVVTGIPYIAQGTLVTAAAATISSITVNGTAITLVFSSVLTSGDPTGAGGITLAMSGGAVTVSSLDVTSGSATVTGILSRSIANGETGTASYSSGSSSVPFANSGGNVANFTGQAVTNSTPAGGAGGAITIQSTGTAASAVGPVSTVSVAYSTVGSIVAGQKLLDLTMLRTDPGDTPSTPADFTLVDSYNAGAGTHSSNVGPRRITVFERTASGSESGSVTHNWTTSSGVSAIARLLRLSGANSGWQATQYARCVNDTGTSVGGSAVSTVSLLPNDLVIAVICTSSADGGASSATLSASGVTLGGTTLVPTFDSGGGAGGTMSVAYASVSSGSAPTSTLSAAVSWTEGNPPSSVEFLVIRNAS